MISAFLSQSNKRFLRRHAVYHHVENQTALLYPHYMHMQQISQLLLNIVFSNFQAYRAQLNLRLEVTVLETFAVFKSGTKETCQTFSLISEWEIRSAFYGEVKNYLKEWAILQYCEILSQFKKWWITIQLSIPLKCISRSSCSHVCIWSFQISFIILL